MEDALRSIYVDPVDDCPDLPALLFLALLSACSHLRYERSSGLLLRQHRHARDAAVLAVGATALLQQTPRHHLQVPSHTSFSWCGATRAALHVLVGIRRTPGWSGQRLLLLVTGSAGVGGPLGAELRPSHDRLRGPGSGGRGHPDPATQGSWDAAGFLGRDGAPRARPQGRRLSQHSVCVRHMAVPAGLSGVRPAWRNPSRKWARLPSPLESIPAMHWICSGITVAVVDGRQLSRHSRYFLIRHARPAPCCQVVLSGSGFMHFWEEMPSVPADVAVTCTRHALQFTVTIMATPLSSARCMMQLSCSASVHGVI